MIIEVKRGLIFENEEKLNCTGADQIARANGLPFAEYFTKKYDDCVLKLDKDLKIVGNIPGQDEIDQIEETRKSKQTPEERETEDKFINEMFSDL